MGFTSVRLGLGVAVVAVALIGAGCQSNPATGQSNFNAISSEQEKRINDEAVPEMVKGYGGPVPDPQVVSYVNDIAQRLAAQSERPDLVWTFHVVDSSVVNAFALPAGDIFLTRGLMEKLTNEAQLAGVIGHEIGHVTARHVGQRLTQAYAITLAGVALGVAGEVADEDWLRYLGAGTSVGGGVYLLSFGRGQESQSDELGVRYMTKLGYNPVGLIQVMEVFQSLGGGGRQPEFFSTHPYPETRIERLTKLIREKHPNFEDPAAYRFGFESYKANVLDRFAALPPPAHNPQAGASIGVPASLARLPHEHTPHCQHAP